MLTHLLTAHPRVAHRLARWLNVRIVVAMFCPCVDCDAVTSELSELW